MDQNRRLLANQLLRHRPSRWWVLLWMLRCRDCGVPWPCPRLVDLVAELARPESGQLPEWSQERTVAQRPVPPVPRAPLLTRGQERRSNPGQHYG